MIRFRPTWVEISKSAFSHNVRRMKGVLGSKVELCAVLKADAYGHGAESLAPLALQNGATSIGVSSLEEGLALRQSGVLSPVLILGGIYPLKNFAVAVQSNLTPTVASFEAAKFLKRLAQEMRRTVAFHLKVDTGMGRIGVSLGEAERILKWSSHQEDVVLEGVYSHLSSSDGSASFSISQNRKFLKIKKLAEKLGFSQTKFHLANSAGTVRFPQTRHSMVRTGILLYGISPLVDKQTKFSPVLSWKTKVVFLKKVPKGMPISYGRTFVTKRSSMIATLTVGYADGVPRLASNRGHVLVRGEKCPIVGRVTMDHIMIDVTNKNVAIGDTVILIGKQKKQSISMHDWAKWAQTNPYEICCGISKRVPRNLV